jgi:hypothetical protein
MFEATTKNPLAWFPEVAIGPPPARRLNTPSTPPETTSKDEIPLRQGRPRVKLPSSAAAAWGRDHFKLVTQNEFVAAMKQADNDYVPPPKSSPTQPSTRQKPWPLLAIESLLRGDDPPAQDPAAAASLEEHEQAGLEEHDERWPAVEEMVEDEEQRAIRLQREEQCRQILSAREERRRSGKLTLPALPVELWMEVAKQLPARGRYAFSCSTYDAYSIVQADTTVWDVTECDFGGADQMMSSMSVVTAALASHDDTVASSGRSGGFANVKEPRVTANFRVQHILVVRCTDHDKERYMAHDVYSTQKFTVALCNVGNSLRRLEIFDNPLLTSDLLGLVLPRLPSLYYVGKRSQLHHPSSPPSFLPLPDSSSLLPMPVIFLFDGLMLSCSLDHQRSFSVPAHRLVGRTCSPWTHSRHCLWDEYPP